MHVQLITVIKKSLFIFLRRDDPIRPKVSPWLEDERKNKNNSVAVRVAIN